MKEVRGRGARSARIVCVGEAPGGQEELRGEPFVGPAGDLLTKELLGVGINPDTEVYFDNVVPWRPPDNELYRWFSQDQMGIPAECVVQGMDMLRATLEEIKPNVVVACGNYPLWALSAGRTKWAYDKDDKHWRMSGIQKWRGNILPCTLVPGLKVIPTFHPSYILRQGRWDSGSFIADLLRVREDSAFPELRYPETTLYLDMPFDPKYTYNHCGETLKWIGPSDFGWIRDKLLREGEVITFDIEYIGSKLLCVGFCVNAREAYTIRADSPGAMQLFREVLLSGKALNAQNSMYDISIMEWHYDIPCMQYIRYDTMLVAHAANPELPKGLDYLESIYTRYPNHKDMVDWKLIKAGKQSIRTVLHYNGFDCVSQHAVMEAQHQWELGNKKVAQVAEFETALNSILWDVSKRGVCIDTVKMESIRTATSAELLGHQAIINVLAGETVNVASYPQVGEFLFKRMGIPSPGKNPGGSYKTDDKTLADITPSLKHDVHRDAVKAVRMARKMRNRLSKFVDVELDSDGRSRGMYSPAGTGTGRLASKKFYPTGFGHQQQNIPRDPLIRSVFVPDPGKGYGYFDLERAESLCVAHICNDPLMLQHHAPGADAHRLLGEILFGIPAAELTDDQRYLGKQTRHAGNYMEGPRTMMLNVNKLADETGVWVTEADCKKHITTYRQVHTNLTPWWREVESRLWRDHRCANMLGWEREFYGHVGSIVPNAVAFNPQSTVGHVLNVGVCLMHGVILDYFRDRLTMDPKTIVELSQELRGAWGFEMLQQVHDAVGFQYDLRYEREVAWAVSRLMEVRLRNPRTYEEFIIPVEAAISHSSWGDTKNGKIPLHTLSEPVDWRRAS